MEQQQQQQQRQQHQQQLLYHQRGPRNTFQACSRHYCPELVEHHRSEFAACCEEEDAGAALEGLAKAAPRLRNLDKLNRMLAHRPWTVTKETIRELIVCPDGSCDKWSMSELIQAILLLSHFHAFSSFALGCGKLKGLKDRKERGRTAQSITDATEAIAAATAAATAARASSVEININDEEFEEDKEDRSSAVGSLEDRASQHMTMAEVGEVPSILRKMEALSERREELEMAELARRFERINREEDDDNNCGGGIDVVDKPTPSTIVVAFTDELAFKYVDFVSRGSPAEYPTVRYTDLNWDDHVFPTIRQLYNEEISQILDDKFDIIQNLTYMTIGRYTSVDTTMFRRAVQNYVQCLFGIRHDDYDYAEVNELLPRPLKKYIKTVCCYAETCTLEEYSSIMTEFLESEKVHVCLLVCEARFQASLLYACRAVSQHFSGKL